MFTRCRTTLSSAVKAQPTTRRSPAAGLPALALACSLLLASCGGGAGNPATPGDPDASLRVQPSMVPTDRSEAHRFLVQASFGPDANSIARVNKIGYDNWIDEQMAKPLGTRYLTLTEASSAQRQNEGPDSYDVIGGWWTNAVRDPAQLRQRVTFALSEIFVVSTLSVNNGRLVASYMDTLYDHSNGKYRDLLKAVALHPAMGQYLSHMGNRKGDPATGRVPDENFAREVMQLFSIGLQQLTPDGEVIQVNGQAVESYTADDVKGMARVFTGWSWHIPDGKAALDWWLCFWRSAQCKDTSQETLPMSAYKTEHEPGPKAFLDTRIEQQTANAEGNAERSLASAINRLATHPNTAPFISRQLIQRLVTSNPSRAYVGDVAKVFRDSDGDLTQVVKAILLHDEARNPSNYPVATYGKLREPVIRYAHILRAVPHSSIAYNASATAGRVPVYMVTETDDVNAGLGQTPMRAPSVFNFFRPGYRPPRSLMGAATLVAPEMQITSEASTLGYANFVSNNLTTGWGLRNNPQNRNDVQFDTGGWNGVATSASQLMDAVATAMIGRVLPNDTRTQAIAVLNSMPVTQANGAADANGIRMRIQSAILLTAVSPEFTVQQ